MPDRKTLKPCQGFTVAELLIALAILGAIAAFTIPKILATQQDQKFRSIVKETAAMLTGALVAYKTTNTLNSNTTAGALTPYMNYLKIDNTSTFDYEYGSSTGDCGSGTDVCLKLHNGAILNYVPTNKFNGIDTTNAVYFISIPMV